jgi:thiol-disulfide isomerase/thioredoxin
MKKMLTSLLLLLVCSTGIAGDFVNPNKSRQLLYFTASWCGPCQHFKATQVPKLKAVGWKISSEKSANIVEIDVDLNREEYNKYIPNGSVPTFVKLRYGVPVGKLVGFQTAETIAAFVNQ